MSSEQRPAILQMIPALNGGGAERCVLQTAAAVADAGYRSLVLSGGGILVSELQAFGVRHVQMPIGRKSPRTLFLFPALRRLLHTERVVLVDVHSRVPAWLLELTQRVLPAGSRVAVVTTGHGLNRPGVWSRVMTRGDRVIAVSDAVGRHLQAMDPRLQEDRLRVIPRGVDQREFSPRFVPDEAWKQELLREMPGIEGRRLLLLPGRLKRSRGQRAFLELVAELTRQGEAVFGLITGSDGGRPTERQKIVQRAQELAVSDRVGVLDHRRDMRELYATADVVLSLPERPESFGLVVAEALSMGRPIVAWDHGGAGELLAQVWPSGAVSAGNLRELTGVVSALLRGELAAPQPACPYSLSQTTSRTLEVYAELLQGDSAATAP